MSLLYPRTTHLFLLNIIALLVVINVAFILRIYAFSEPASAPPGGNVNPPINTSGAAQTKTGDFTVSNGVDRVLTSDLLSTGSLTLINTSLGAGNAFAVTPTLSGGSITAADLIVKGGNVGIGIVSPEAKLDVNGTIKLSGASPTFKMTNVISPSVSSDVATKGYVDSQVSAAASKTPKKQIFLASGTWTPPAASTWVAVMVVGGGGGGASGNGATVGGGGGGSGNVTFYTGLVSSSQTVTVGAGGGGAGGFSGAGTTGGTSSFGGLASALGGTGGRNDMSADGGGGYTGGSAGGEGPNSGSGGIGFMGIASGGGGGAYGSGAGSGGRGAVIVEWLE